MSIPVAFQQFKSAGIYRVVYDKSTVLNEDAEILRLVVGYSEKGPFNQPVYVKGISEFKEYFGDISKKLEKRGDYFHRTAIQALGAGPILCLNLKPFDDDLNKLSASTVDTEFNPLVPIKTVDDIPVRNVYDRTKFWELNADTLDDLSRRVNGRDIKLDQEQKYFHIATTDSSVNSGSYFLRKASGNKVNGYDITVQDWYKSSNEEIPDYLAPYTTSLISDFFAEIYVFSGKFDKEQVLGSDGLKNYFDVWFDEDGNDHLVLKPYVLNPFGDATDTLDALFNDDRSGAIGHYIGCILPTFKDKSGRYQSLDILFNSDIDSHHMMMNFNYELLDADNDFYTPNLDLSGYFLIKDNLIEKLFKGEAKSTLFGNSNATIFADVIGDTSKFTDTADEGVSPISTVHESLVPLNRTADGTQIDSIYGTSVSFIQNLETYDAESASYVSSWKESDTANRWESTVDSLWSDILNPGDRVLGTGFDKGGNPALVNVVESGQDSDGTYFVQFANPVKTVNGVYKDFSYVIASDPSELGAQWIREIPAQDVYTESPTGELVFSRTVPAVPGHWMYGTYEHHDAEYSAYDGGKIISPAWNDELPQRADLKDVAFSGIVRIDKPLNQEIGLMEPVYLKGYDYPQGKPESTDMMSKLKWQWMILDTLNDSGIHTALLSRSEIDYRYIIDTFEGFIEPGCKNKLSFLAKEKESCLAILNFPSVRTFIKCPYASFTNEKGMFNVQYIVDGANKKKAASLKFALPSDAEGASFCAFYTPLKFSDGYIDMMVPSAGLVSNLFMEKYKSRQPYYIIAGPNYGVMNYSGLVGPDYHYSRAELNIIEPYGVNCMVYRPGFGTFINANQTAKQSPKSALSSVNVRELVIYLQDEIEKLLQAYQWEFNNPTVRQQIKDRADVICDRVKQNGGLLAYLNVMDESNNTPDIIDNEIAVLSTHIEAGRGAGKMIHELTIYRTGQLSALILEQ